MKVLITTMIGLALSACTTTQLHLPETQGNKGSVNRAQLADNPFIQPSQLHLHYPPFDKINHSHFAPAFDLGMREGLSEILAIANNPDSPTFDNTIVAMEKSGELLTRVSRVFFALVSANTNDELNALRSDIAPRLSAYSDEILLHPQLFKRVEKVYHDLSSLALDSESARLVRETYKSFIRAGAQLPDQDKERLKAMNEELATLGTQFSQNVLNEVNDKAIVIDSVEDLNGMSKEQIAAAAEAASLRELKGKYVLPLLNTSQQPALSSLENREVRRRILATSLGRGSSGGDYDNKAIFTRVIELRAERAQLLGFDHHAAYQLDVQTAKTTKAVNQRLLSLVRPAIDNAQREANDLQTMIDATKEDFLLAAWDWDFYAEKVRAKRYNFDESQLKPYLEMENVLVNGVFFAAEQLYGLSFKARPDLPTYHPDVKVWEVFDNNGETLALFIQDFYARESKRGGAWMNAYVQQSTLAGTKAVVANHLNVAKPPKGMPTLLTWNEVNTMFHEFGHALHGMFSNVQYPSFSGTSVPRDFVEYPSQVNEMWADWPTVLANYAVHYETGAPMPKALLDKILASAKFNQGYATTEYLAASLLDQAWHQLTPEQVPSADKLIDFELKALKAARLDVQEIPPRYRSTYFSHIMGGYSAGYYSYIWSEVLDADTVEWFKKNGGMTRANGDHFRTTLLSRGGAEDAMTLFKKFRGAEPNIEPLLIRRGLK